MELTTVTAEKLAAMYDERCRGKDGQYHENAGMWPYLPVLRSLVLQTRAQQVIELGVHAGGSTSAFLLALMETGGKLWSCDIMPPQSPINRLELRLSQDHPQLWTFVRGDTTELALEGLPPTSCDVLLVDAAFENRYMDLVHYGLRVRPGGFILIHDSNRNEEVREQVERWLALAWPADRCRETYLADNHGLAVIGVR